MVVVVSFDWEEERGGDNTLSAIPLSSPSVSNVRLSLSLSLSQPAKSVLWVEGSSLQSSWILKDVIALNLVRNLLSISNGRWVFLSGYKFWKVENLKNFLFLIVEAMENGGIIHMMTKKIILSNMKFKFWTLVNVWRVLSLLSIHISNLNPSYY